MTAIFLIFFSVLFYQLLVKPALNPTTSPNTNRNEQNEHLMRIWRNLQQFQGEKRERKQHIKTEQTRTENVSNSQAEGFKGGEYIDYEEM
ncbi:MAG: hypothetical protein JKY03_08035 [Aureispira sp.]|nr:hypothetical protein [Aureispira sp.]